MQTLLLLTMFLKAPGNISLFETIKMADYKLFSKINGQWHNSFFDIFFPFTRESFVWVPFYFFLLIFIVLNFKVRGWVWALFFIATAVLSDFISSDIIKDLVFRVRPCHDPMVTDHIRFLVSYCPNSSSFTSSHATNHFAVAMYIFTTFKHPLNKWWGAIFLWALIISYAQVYVGVHFPLDVICGAVVGLMVGYLPAIIYNKKIGLKEPER
ncbi:MAG: phosphatase PAP2 family protein [Ginsengibacter sp.]